MANLPVNATGWSDLIEGNMITAVYNMFNIAFGGHGIIIVILFVIYQVMLYSKTQNLTLMWIVGILFVSMYGLSIFVEPFSLQLMFLILVFELGGILYLLLFDK